MVYSPFMRQAPRYLVLSLFSGLLLSAAWYGHLTFFVFVAIVPLLVIEDRLSNDRENTRPGLKLLGYSYLAFFMWNILVTWWVAYASFGGACMAIVFNSLFMSFVFLIFSAVKKRLGKMGSTWLLIPIWLAWEHWHTIWDLTWTWLTIGNVFAFSHNWVQWYEFTGTSGGSLWALFVNILVFNILKNNSRLKFISVPTLKFAAAIIVPVFISYLILFTRSVNSRTLPEVPVPVVVVQPNVDPYNVKFYLDYQTQFLNMLELLKGKINGQTQYLVLPETFITEDLNENGIGNSEPLFWFRDSLLKKFPNLKIITGGNTYVYYEDEKLKTSTARHDQQSGKYYDVYNAGIYLWGDSVEVYHKSKLVPGVERMPFPALLRPLEKLAINMGGTMGSLGTQDNRQVFKDRLSGNGVAPVICYESVYANYVTEYMRKGATFIFIITNDGWWDDTPGYIQHLNFARLRAIENRREIARCANTGISCFIDQLGNIYQQTKWWKEDVIARDMHSNSELTFFSRYGDLLSMASLWLTGLCLGWCLALSIKGKLFFF